jgi:predicted transcriptional regulator of viral defense system
MTTLKDKIIEKNLSDRVLTDTDLACLLEGTKASRYALVNKAIKQNELIIIRRGLYVLAERYRQQKISQFFLASRMTPYSYISLESALSYHGWIPEAVKTVMSVCNQAYSRTKQFETSFGEFIFYQLPVNEYAFLEDIERIEIDDSSSFLIATPMRALADYVYLRKIDKMDLRYLIENLRIEEENCMKLKIEDFESLFKIYRSKRVLSFLENLGKECKVI